MSRYSIVKDGVVINTMKSDEGFAQQLAADLGGSYHLDGGGVGAQWDGSVFTEKVVEDEPVAPITENMITKTDFLRSLTADEKAHIFSSVNPFVVAFVKTFEALFHKIDLLDPDVIGSVTYLSTIDVVDFTTGGTIKMMTPERVVEVLGE